MPRTARASVGGICYHVLNRGNGRAEVFHDPADYRAFLDLLQEAGERVPMRMLGFCLMPPLRARESEALARSPG